MSDYEDGLRRLNPVEWRKQYEGTWEPPGPLSDAELEHMERRHYKGNQDAYRLTKEVRRLRGVIADQERTLTAAGIVVGEDGAVRWHGLTGAEIEAAIALIREVIDNEDVYTVLNDSGIDACLFCRAEMESGVDDGNPHDPDCWIVRADVALAAAAGRGADGEAGE